jgi:hypothetical protein
MRRQVAANFHSKNRYSFMGDVARRHEAQLRGNRSAPPALQSYRMAWYRD